MFTELRKRILEDQEKEIANGYFDNLEHTKLLNIISDSDIEKKFWNTSRKTLRNRPKELDRREFDSFIYQNNLAGLIKPTFFMSIF